MAKTKNNIFMSGLSGTIGRQMTLSQKAGDTIVGKKRGASTIPATDDQLDIQSRFKISSRYAIAAIKDPATKAAYAAVAKRGQSAYNVAFADAFTPPEITSIDTASFHANAGDTVMVRTIDDFKVIAVNVVIQNDAGLVLESGEAVLQLNGLDWKYTVASVFQTPGSFKITATATDRPANQTKKFVQVVV
jgi:hypothetical protein